jgi:hypothetical protein
MKLTATTVDRTLDQVEAEVIPDDHPAAERLSTVFGDHTFFVNNSGLLVVEESDGKGDGAQTGRLVKLADWNDGRTALVPHPPEPTEVEVALAPEDGSTAA